MTKPEVPTVVPKAKGGRVLIGALVVGALLVGVLVGWFLPHAEKVAVQNVVNLSQSNAQLVISAEGLKTSVVNLNHSSAHPPAPRTVLAQFPAAGTLVAKGSRVQLNVYLSTVAVPWVVGQSASAAISSLQRAGLRARYLSDHTFNSAAPGIIFAQNHGAGEVVAGGTLVIIYANS